jgi:histidinol-phosphate aminotransferase
MKSRFKPHISAMNRYQTSTGRDLENGLRLDRNERVADAMPDVLNKIWASLPSYILHVTPDISDLYGKIAKEHEVNRDKVYITNGITEGVRFLYDTLTNPGENVIVLDPTYPLYWIYAEMFQLDYRKFTYNADSSLNWDSLYNNIDDNTAIVAIANPNLPVESAISSAKIRELATYCQEKEIVLVIDEAYHGFGSSSVIDLIDEFDNLVVLRTFSKAWGLAAIRLGYMISQPENIEYFTQTRALVETNALSMEIAMYALDHQHLRSDLISEVKEGAKYLQDELNALSLKWHGGDYTNGILIFLNSAEESNAVYHYMRERKIYIRGSFEKPYDCCIRASIGPKNAMTTFILALKEWLNAGRPIV